MTRVRLGGSYLFHVPPGTYSMAALYIAAHTHQHMPPSLLAVGESFAEVVIGDRRSVLQAPTTAHLAAIVKAPESQKSFVIPEGATTQVHLGKDTLYQCVARERTSPNDRCRSTQRGALVCARHRQTSVVDARTREPLP